MSLPRNCRAVAAFAMALGLMIVVSGCGGGKPNADKGAEKKADPTPSPPPGTNTPGTTPTPPETVPTPKIDEMPRPPEKVDYTTGVGKEATELLTAFAMGNLKADRLSTSFVKMIGLPAELPPDKARGFSTDAAEVWLRRVGQGFMGFAPPSMSRHQGDVAVFRGRYTAGGYTLRLVKEGGAWKIDWIALSSTKCDSTLDVGNAETGFQDFAVIAAFEVLTDRDGMPKDDRIFAIAAALAPPYRKKLAEPLGSDMDQKLDYNRGQLSLATARYHEGVESFTVTHQGNSPVYRVELVRMGGARSAFVVKLTQGTLPGQWLVEDITPA
jgi:hypothetical protein